MEGASVSRKPGEAQGFHPAGRRRPGGARRAGGRGDRRRDAPRSVRGTRRARGGRRAGGARLRRRRRRARGFTLSDEPAGSLARRHDAGFFEGPLTISSRSRSSTGRATPAAGGGGADPYSFGPVLGPMDDYYIREACTCGSSTGWARTRSTTRAPRRALRGLGAERQPRQRHRRLQRLGRPAPRHAAAPATPASGRSSSPGSPPASPTSSRSSARTATAAEGRPLRPRLGAPAGHRLGRGARARARLGRRRAPRALEHRRRPAPADLDLRGAPRLLAARRRGFLSWDELADRLIPYVADLGFTPHRVPAGHRAPLRPVLGLQTTGLYAPSARFGPPEGFARFVDGAHRAGIGVILDWVPAHFPTDEHGLALCDGTALYEHEDPRQGFHPDWNTAIYNFGRQEVFSLPDQQRPLLV